MPRTAPRTPGPTSTRVSALVLTLAAGLAGPLLGPPPAAHAGPRAESRPESRAEFRTGAGYTPAPGRVVATDRSGTGTWRVRAAGVGAWQVSWTSPTRLPVAGDRPAVVAEEPGATGDAVGVPVVGQDGRTVTAVVASPTAPAPADLAVVLSGRTLDETAPVGGGPAARWTEPDRTLLEVDPATRGDSAVETSDYTLAPLTLPGLEQPVEMKGHVVQPQTPDPGAPLVLFLHGRHAYCYNADKDRLTWHWPCGRRSQEVPSQLGYDYLQRRLASQGYVTVSVAANGINAQDGDLMDAGAAARATLVQRHLDQWAAWDQAGTEVADLDHVVLVGHSRGGEGVARAALDIGLSAPYHIDGQVLIAPTDFSRQTVPYVPTVTLLPSCDGDVSDLQGQTFTDAARDVVDDDTSLKSSVMVVGANHNFFNTEWTPGRAAAPAADDWYLGRGACAVGAPHRLGAAAQRRTGLAAITGAVRLFASDERDFLPLFDGSPVRVSSAGKAVLLSHALGLGRQLGRPGIDATPAPGATAEVGLCRGVAPYRRGTRACGHGTRGIGETPHWPAAFARVPTQPALSMTWTERGEAGGLDLGEPWDLTGATSLDLRTVVAVDPGDVRLDVRVTDSAGAAVVVTPPDEGLLPALPKGPRYYGKAWAQDLRIPTTALTGIDLTSVTTVELVGRSDRGRVWVLDVAAVPSVVPPVPDLRIARLDLGEVTVVEGGEGTQTAQVPFSVTGTVRDDARVWVQAAFDEPSTRRVVVDLAPGATSGSLSWPYQGDEADGQDLTFTPLVAYARRNLMVSDHLGALTVTDDDPAPEVSVEALTPQVREGGVARWRVSLSRPTEDYVVIRTRPRDPGPGSDGAEAGDVTADWRAENTRGCAREGTPFSDCRVTRFVEIEPGGLEAVIEIPVARDGSPEPAEAITLRLVTLGIVGAGEATVEIRTSR